MIPGENAEASRVDGETGRQAVLHAEVRHAGVGMLGMVGPEPARLRHVAAQIVERAVEVGQEGGVGGRVLELLARDAAQEQHRVALRISPASPGRGAGRACTSWCPRSSGGCRRVPPARSSGRGCEDRRRTDGSFAWPHYPTVAYRGSPSVSSRVLRAFAGISPLLRGDAGRRRRLHPR